MTEHEPTVLLCDDDDSIQQVMEVIFSKFGIRSAGLKRITSIDEIKSKQPALILMDLNIPDSGGKAIVHELKQDEDTKNIPVLMFSGSPQLESEAKEAGADGYLEKPFDIDHLIGEIGKRLGRNYSAS